MHHQQHCVVPSHDEVDVQLEMTITPESVPYFGISLQPRITCTPKPAPLKTRGDSAYFFIMQTVLPNLYISSWYAIIGKGVLQKERITHVLTVMKDISSSSALNPYKRMIIAVNDDPTEHLIDYFESATQWIDDAIADGGKVVVHWYAPRGC
jgi:Dual specificity phosphatase, catalytic domain